MSGRLGGDSANPLQGQDTAARSTDVAKQQLQDSGSADDLHALGMLRPAHCVADRGGLIRTGSGGKGISYF